jgi:SAM-dependent methyltransferase/uncharacterized protein YbaR (Trm112 family)
VAETTAAHGRDEVAGVNEDRSRLVELVACPSCRSDVASVFGGLECAGCGRTFELEGAVPAMFVGATPTSTSSFLSAVHYALLGSPRVYEFHQRIGRAGRIAAEVASTLSVATGATLLDVGAGTGMVASLLPPDATYVWFDNDRQKLKGFLAKRAKALAVLGDAARLPYSDGAVDWSTMVEVSHHLPDDVLRDCLREIARVTRERFVFVDGLRGDRLRSRLMWQLDLGRFPRREETLIDALEEHFELETVRRFRVNHDHLLCVCAPRDGGSANRPQRRTSTEQSET